MRLAEAYSICIPLICLCLSADVSLLGVTIYQLYIQNNYITMNNSFKILTLIIMISFTLCTLGDIIHLMIRYHFNLTSHRWNPSDAYLAGIKDILYYIGNVVFFILLFRRIKTSFQLSKCIMCCLTILLAIFIIFCFIYCYIILSFVGQSGSKVEQYWANASYPVSFTDFLLDACLFILFIYKIRNRHSIEGIEIADDIIMSRQSIDQYNNKKSIWNVMIKHCVLFGVALFLNQSWYIINVLDNSDITLSWALVRGYSVRAVENVVNIFILWLVLKVNNHRYIWLCKCWHKCILRFCMKEDPDIIREGFVVDDKEQSLITGIDDMAMLIINDSRNDDVAPDAMEGHSLIVTDFLVAKADYKVEGHDLLLTANI